MIGESIFRILDAHNYAKWIKEFDTLTDDDVKFFQHELAVLTFNPRIAIVPAFNCTPTEAELSALTRRHSSQLYRNWCLYSPDIPFRNESLLPATAALLPSSIVKAAEIADFVLPLPVDAVLRSHALGKFVLSLSEVPDADMIYADEDISQNDRRSQPHFKTDWDPYLILGSNYVGVPALYRSEAIRRAGLENLTGTTIDNMLHAVTLRVCEMTPKRKILHIPSILCHRTQESDWNAAEARRIVATHLAKRNAGASEISPAPLAPQWNRVKFPLPEPLPLVSLIVPTRDRADLIGRCCDGILNQTDYPSLELIVVDNGTAAPDALAVLDSLKDDPRVEVLRDERPFNYSELNNFAARSAKGDILVLLNNDIEVMHKGWLKELVSLASRPEIGIVGAKLLYPDLRVQHAGMVFGPDRLVVHQMRLASQHEAGPYGELSLLRTVSAVTGACMAVRKNVYFDVGGLDEDNLKVACNDIDFCRRVGKKGLAIVWTPFAELTHHECATRGRPLTPEKAARETAEIMRFWSMNRDLYEDADPFHNPQIEFKHDCVDFARPPRLHRFRKGISERQAVAFLY
jgi:O-antigen biosynthesis protein